MADIQFNKCIIGHMKSLRSQNDQIKVKEKYFTNIIRGTQKFNSSPELNPFAKGDVPGLEQLNVENAVVPEGKRVQSFVESS